MKTLIAAGTFVKIRCALCIFAALVVIKTPAHAAAVLSIGDGDTITVTEGAQKIRVRLACIDTPETSQTPYGMESREALQKLLPIGAEVTVRTKATDRYGRTVGEVLKGSTNINQSLVGSGNAFVYWQYISGCDRQTYSQLENDARLKRLGVWSVPNGIQRPWDYRRNRRGGSSASSSGSSSAGSGKYRCKEIGSWEKAQALLKQGHTYLDRDGDGEACESLK
jgi:endonuclease YncB( thermonuclease family)